MSAAAGAVRARTRLVLRRDGTLRVVAVTLVAAAVAAMVLATMWDSGTGMLAALAAGTMPAPLLAMLILTGPLTRDEASGATRSLLAAAVQPAAIARGTSQAVAGPPAVLGAVTALAVGAIALGHAGAETTASSAAALLLTAAVAGPAVGWASTRLATLVALLRGTQLALVVVWVVLVVAAGMLVLVATGLVAATSWALTAAALVVAGSLAVGAWGLSADATPENVLR